MPGTYRWYALSFADAYFATAADIATLGTIYRALERCALQALKLRCRQHLTLLRILRDMCLAWFLLLGVYVARGRGRLLSDPPPVLPCMRVAVTCRRWRGDSLATTLSFTLLPLVNTCALVANGSPAVRERTKGGHLVASLLPCLLPTLLPPAFLSFCFMCFPAF